MQDLSSLLTKFPKKSLAFLPTPIQFLQQSSDSLQGPKIYIKRDDHTGLAFGGNKTRKLEYLFGHALEQDIDTIITAGALQSNHCRQTAAAAAQLGLSCELLLHSTKPKSIEGNVLLDTLSNAKIHWQLEPDAPKSLEELAVQLKSQNKKPYIIPYGGSNAIGSLGYVQAMFEFCKQQQALPNKVTHIIFASCSGATQVGLEIGARLAGFTGKIIGISVDYNDSQKSTYQQEHADLANNTAQHMQNNLHFTPEDFSIIYDYATGYAQIGNLEKNAIHFLAQHEGIFLDPIYSGRAFGAMLDMIQKNYFTKDDVLLFWHTGGTPALFAFQQEIL